MLIAKGSLTKSGSTRKKFQRRKDLTEKIRADIAISAYLAQEHSQWGAITAISEKYGVSRPFVYSSLSILRKSLKMAYCQDSYEASSAEAVQAALEHIFSLRLEGRCSISGISTCMKRFGLPNSSEGFISQYLTKVGSQLPSTFSNEEGIVQLAVFASDEIFSKSKPILVTVDPVSSVILRIELSETRKAEDWINHWECIEDNGFSAIYLVSDEGTGLTSGHSKGLYDRPFQPDTYHTIAHRLGHWLERLEKKAYQAMKNEYDRLKAFNSAKSGPVIEEKMSKYESAMYKTMQSIKMYEDFSYLYSILVKELHIFDSNGNFRDRRIAEKNIKVILDLLDTLNESKLSDAVSKIRKTLPDLLNYFDQGMIIVEKLKKVGFDENALKALCAGWQWHRGVIKSKKSQRRHYCRDNEVFCLEIASGYLQEQYEDVKDQVYNELNCVVQSSAMVECINSIIRPYLNTSRNLITQETLNLIMFYHNHRRYKDGERAGKTPYELLSGEQQEKDWMALLFETIDATPSGLDELPHQYSDQEKTDEMLTCYRVSDDYAVGMAASH